MSKKQSWLLLGGIILASCVFSLVIQLLGVEGNARSIAITFWMVAMVVIYAYVTLTAGRKTVKKIQEANKLLTEEKDLDAYIEALNALLVSEKDSLQAQQVLRINLTVAYIGKHDYESALKALREIPDPKRLNRANSAFYWVNLALCNFYTGNDEEGMRIVDLQKKAFAEMRKVAQPGPALAFLEILEMYNRGFAEDAAALFETARATWEQEDNKAEFALIAEKIGAELLPLPEKLENEHDEEEE